MNEALKIFSLSCSLEFSPPTQLAEQSLEANRKASGNRSIARPVPATSMRISSLLSGHQKSRWPKLLISFWIAETGQRLARLQQLKQQGKLKAAMDSLRFRLTEVTPKDLPVLLSALIRTDESRVKRGRSWQDKFQNTGMFAGFFDVLDRIQRWKGLTSFGISRSVFLHQRRFEYHKHD